MDFIRLQNGDTDGIRTMSALASSIVREHFDPLIGTAQNDYMIARFQSEAAITDQLTHGYRYFFLREAGENLGFLAFYPRGGAMYLSKFYLKKEQRGKGLSHIMLDFVIEAARREGLGSIELNVNRHNSACRAYDSLGFHILREEKNDIGGGFFMDDYVYELPL